MKTALLLALLSTTASARVAPYWHQLDGYSFEQYMKDFHKSYTGTELLKRKALFETRLDAIRAHNKKGLSWKNGVNHMTDYTDAERKSMLGLDRAGAYIRREANRATEEADAARGGFTRRRLEDLPSKVDWRNQGILTGVKDQGQCGSCWAFSATETLESQLAMATGELVSLSPEQIASCSPNPNQCGGTGGCDGGTYQIGWDAVQKSGGIATAFTYGYDTYWGTNKPCRFKNENGGTPVFAKLSGHVNIPTNDYAALMTAVARHPTSVSADASLWSDYESGVYAGCSANSNSTAVIDHAIQAVGYGTDPKHGDYCALYIPSHRRPAFVTASPLCTDHPQLVVPEVGYGRLHDAEALVQPHPLLH